MTDQEIVDQVHRSIAGCKVCYLNNKDCYKFITVQYGYIRISTLFDSPEIIVSKIRKSIRDTNNDGINVFNNTIKSYLAEKEYLTDKINGIVSTTKNIIRLSHKNRRKELP